MLYLFATLHTLRTTLIEDARERLSNDRGSVTIEQVMWALAMITFVGIVAAAIKAFVEAKAGQIG
ncbi:MAG: hypothetical protein L0G89_00315 [Janibacter sp.]|nr:hypothetical protein [Janibacter sp.]